MPIKGRGIAREGRKKKVLLAFRRKRAMTAAEVAAACGWPVAVTTRIISALVTEPKPRLRRSGEKVVRYQKVEKAVSVYTVPKDVDPMALPAWLRNPPTMQEPESEEEDDEALPTRG